MQVGEWRLVADVVGVVGVPPPRPHGDMDGVDVVDHTIPNAGSYTM